MVCYICLASNPALVAYESVLSGSAFDYILLSSYLLFFAFFFSLSSSYFLYTLLLPGYFQIPPWTTYLVGEIQLTNYAFSHDKLCHNLDPLLVSLFLFIYFFLSCCKTDMVGLGWVGLETEPQKVAGKAS